MNVPELLAKFSTMRVLVIGDTIIDINTQCETLGPSVEDDGAVLRSVSTEETDGGAALVVRNLFNLGASVTFITDVVSAVTKNRFWLNGKKVFHVDEINDTVMTEADIENQFNTFYRDHDAIVVADYRHGFITKPLAELFASVHDPKRPVYVSSQVAQKPSNHIWYGAAPMFVANEKEAQYLYPFCRNAVITLGESGSMRWGLGGRDVRIIPAIKIDAVDTCGAGDAFLAAYVLSGDLEFANTWAGLSCTVRGPNPPTIPMLEEWVNAHP